MGGMRMPNGVRRPTGKQPKAMSPQPMASSKGPSMGTNNLNTAGPNMGFSKGGMVKDKKAKAGKGGSNVRGVSTDKKVDNWTSKVPHMNKGGRVKKKK